MIMAYVFISTKPGTSEDVAETLRGKGGVMRADSVYGRFDVIALIQAKDLKTLDEMVYKTIGSNSNVLHSETAIILFRKE